SDRELHRSKAAYFF
nr:RecName: Full=31 kDa cell wall protein [Arabidopsis thaliana]